MVIDGDISVGFFWMATRYLNLLTFPLYRCQNEYQKLLRAGEGAKRVFAFLEENPTETQDGITGINLQGKVRFEDVTFGYNETEAVLENVNFEVQPGQIAALVGPSGAGKAQFSTSFRVFTRLTRDRFVLMITILRHSIWVPYAPRLAQCFKTRTSSRVQLRKTSEWRHDTQKV